MDTKSKNINRYPLIIKALCLVLTVLCFLGACMCGIYGVLAIKFRPWTGDATPVSFAQSDLFCEMVQSDLGYIGNVLDIPRQKQMLETYRAQRDSLIDEEVQRYLTEKAAVIRAEIYYVATHYDELEGDYYYEAYMRDFSTTTTTAPAETTTHPAETPADVSTPATSAPATEPTSGSADLSALPKVQVDDRAPYNVRYCQGLCNTVTGLDWLQYESLVRDSAFREKEFTPSYGDLGHMNTYSLDQSEPQIRSEFEREYDNLLQRYTDSYEDDYDRRHLDGLRNLKYLAIAEDGTVSTNMASAERNGKNILAHSRYILCKGGSVTVHMQDAVHESQINAVVRDQIVPTGGTLYVFFEEPPFVSGDHYATANELFDRLFVRIAPTTVLLCAIAFVIGTLLFFVTLLCLCGHKAGAEGITPAFIDRVPTDIHLLVSGALFLALGVFSAKMIISFGDSVWHPESLADTSAFAFTVGYELIFMLAALAGMYLCALEWLTSTVRIKKARQSYFRGFVLWKLVRLAWRGVKYCIRKVVSLIRFLLDKPKKLRRLPFLACGAYIVAVLLIVLAGVAADEPGPVYIGIPLVTILLVLVSVWFLRMLDRIADAAANRTDLPQDVTRKMPRALRELAENLSVTNQELDRAVAEAVRNERTKAELITNVSHDLKTPLTSVVTYVDLLKKCDITDPQALEYLAVLEEKSGKLKRLIEDLVEASKINTGNVTLQCVPLNLAELATQATAEAASDFEQNDLDLKFTPPEHAPVVFADGQKTFRILDNLLSNARKYSAPHTRVYARVYEDGQFGVFEIKNTSREPLDIDPAELMERFVRGDRSRTQDGNGLGLSIAQQLCALQGGRLDIQIDGDLFKATVYLPKRGGSGQQEAI